MLEDASAFNLQLALVWAGLKWLLYLVKSFNGRSRLLKLWLFLEIFRLLFEVLPHKYFVVYEVSSPNKVRSYFSANYFFILFLCASIFRN